VVIGASPKAGLLAMTAARLTRVPRRIFLHRGARWETLTGHQRRLTMAAERVTCANATDVVAVSDSLADLVVTSGISKRRPVVLGPGGSKGVDLERFTPRPVEGAGDSAADRGAEPPVLGFVGRLAADKGLDVVLAALAAVRLDAPAARLVIAGDVDAADPPETAILAALSDDPAIELLGWRRDLERVYPLFDVLVFPSAREGLPNAVIEAAACGVPTVGWTATGVRDAVADGSSGRLVPWRDVWAFAAAVRQVVSPSDRVRWREGARAWAERFDTRLISQLWVRLLEEPPGEPVRAP
jgi:glycosyltransferase involved in cell wall biosynthesis